MAQPVTAILSCQNELSAAARLITGDVNEAGLLVGKVISHAFEKFEDGASDDVIWRTMRSDLDALVRRR